MKTLPTDPVTAARPVRTRWLRVGPATIVAAIAGAGIVFWERGGGLDPRPRILAPMVHGGGAALSTPRSVPDPDWVWEQRKLLRLSASEAAGLQVAHERWEAEMRPLKASLDAAAHELRGANSGRSAQGVSLPSLSRQAAPFSDLSRQLAVAQGAWWDSVGSFLMPARRRLLEAAWGAQLSGIGRKQGGML